MNKSDMTNTKQFDIFRDSKSLKFAGENIARDKITA